jgi:murein tripeptide amidase MpaA
MNPLLIHLCLLASFAAAPPGSRAAAADEADGSLAVARFDGDVVARVQIRTPQDLMLVTQLSGDMWSHAAGVGSEADFRLSSSALDTLRRAGVPVRVLIPDLQKRIDAERDRLSVQARGADWFADFKNLAAVNARLDALVAAHPGLVSIVTAGTSIEGRTIRGIRISRYPAGTTLPAFIFNGTAHAREWASTMTAMWIADQMIEQDGVDPHSSAILDSAEVYIFPVQNPDGYEYTWNSNRLWRKNRRKVNASNYGVDMNRNWSVGWGGSGSSSSPSSETYRGTAAFSEPETQGMRNFMQAHTNLVGFIDFHSYSQLWLWPWSYTSTLSPDEAAFEAIGYPMQTALGSLYGTYYEAGPSYVTIYPAAGCIDDWAYGVEGIWSGTIEVRDTGTYGFIMPASEIIPNARENYAAATVMMERLLASCPVAITLGPGAVIAKDTASTVEATAVPNVSTLVTNGVRLKWSVDGGATQTATMTSIGGNKFRATLPAIGCGSQLSWWVEAQTKFITTRAPLNKPNAFNTTVAQACGIPGDLDGDGVVDSADLGLMLLNYGACPVPADCAADLDHDGTVDSADLGILLLNFT